MKPIEKLNMPPLESKTGYGPDHANSIGHNCHIYTNIVFYNNLNRENLKLQESDSKIIDLEHFMVSHFSPINLFIIYIVSLIFFLNLNQL